MATGISHSGFLSFQLASDTLLDAYTTVEENEIIYFREGTAQICLNSLLLENTGVNTMWVKPLPSDCVLVIPSGESRTLDYVRLSGIQVLGDSGQSLRWSGCFY